MSTLAFFILFWRVLEVVFLIFGGAVIAVALRTFIKLLKRHLRFPHWLAFGTVIFGSLSLLAGFFILLGPAITEQLQLLGQKLPDAYLSLKEYLKEFPALAPILDQLDLSRWLGEQQLDSGFFTRAADFFSTTFGALGSVFIVIMSSIFFTAEPKLYSFGILRLFPLKKRERIHQVFLRMDHSLRWWFFGQSISMLILGTTVTVLLGLLDVPLALLLGILTAMMTFVPNLGPIIAGIPSILMALTKGPVTALWVLIIYVIIQNLEGAVITPTIHRRIVSLPPVLIIAVQLILASLIGIPGVLMAMPLVLCILIVVRKLYIEDHLGDDLEREALERN